MLVNGLILSSFSVIGLIVSYYKPEGFNFWSSVFTVLFFAPIAQVLAINNIFNQLISRELFTNLSIIPSATGIIIRGLSQVISDNLVLTMIFLFMMLMH